MSSSFFLRVRRWLPKIGKAGIAFLLLLLIFFQFYRALPKNELRDFGSFYASGQAVSQGLNPYGVYKLTFHIKNKFFDGDNPNLNPPFSLLLFNIFSKFNPFFVFKVWWIISLLLFVLAIWLIVRFYAQQVTWWYLLLILAMPGIWDNFYLGQIYMLLLLATVWAWLLLEKNQVVWAGIFIGVLAAFKPNFLCWPALLFLAGHHKGSVTAMGVFLVLSFIPSLIYGHNVYVQWIQLILQDNPARIAFFSNVSLFGIAYRANAGWTALPLSLIILSVIAFLTWRRKPPLLETSAMGIATSLLISPLAWMHYCLFLVPIFIYRPQTIAMKIGLALLAFPFILVSWSSLESISLKLTIGSIYNLAVLLIFIETGRQALCGNHLDYRKCQNNLLLHF
jgi:hypothetical protein